MPKEMPRPSRLPGRRQTGGVLGDILAFAALLAWATAALAPSLVTDWLVRGAAWPVRLGR